MLALLTTGAIHIALERMRTQRRRLEFLIAATVQNLRKLARFLAYRPPTPASYPA